MARGRKRQLVWSPPADGIHCLHIVPERSTHLAQGGLRPRNLHAPSMLAPCRAPTGGDGDGRVEGVSRDWRVGPPRTSGVRSHSDGCDK